MNDIHRNVFPVEKELRRSRLSKKQQLRELARKAQEKADNPRRKPEVENVKGTSRF